MATVILFIGIIDRGYSADVLNTDDIFTINITMKNYQTSKVNTCQKVLFCKKIYLSSL